MKHARVTHNANRLPYVAGALCAAAVVAGAVVGPALSTGADAMQSSDGRTTVTVIAGSDYNPYGPPAFEGNVAFSLPAENDFVGNEDGDLLAASTESAYIRNESKFDIAVTSLHVSPAEGWNLVSDASASAAENAIDLQVGPTSDRLDAASHLRGEAVGDASAWRMGNLASTELNPSGHANNLTRDLSSPTEVATLRWHVTPQAAE